MMYKRLFAFAITAALLFSVASCSCSPGTPAGIPDKEVYAFIADGLFKNMLPAGAEAEYKIQSHAVKQTETEIEDTVTVAVDIDQGIYKASGTLTAKFYKSKKGKTWKLSYENPAYGEDFRAEWSAEGLWEGTARMWIAEDDECYFSIEISAIDNTSNPPKFTGKMTTDIEILKSRHSTGSNMRLEKNINGEIRPGGGIIFFTDSDDELVYSGGIDIVRNVIEDGRCVHPIVSDMWYEFAVTYKR